MSELHITIKPDGSVEIDAVGYSGTNCLEASRPYEKALGATVSTVSRKKKPEIFSDEGVKTGVTNRNCLKY